MMGGYHEFVVNGKVVCFGIDYRTKRWSVIPIIAQGGERVAPAQLRISGGGGGCLLLFGRNRDFAVGAAAGGVDGLGDLACSGLDHGPLRVLEDDDGEPSSGEVLLMTDVLIVGHHDLEPGVLGSLDQVAICELLPASGPRFIYGVCGEEEGQAARDSVIEENQHVRWKQPEYAGVRRALRRPALFQVSVRRSPSGCRSGRG
jgi:hypothetical protein